MYMHNYSTSIASWKIVLIIVILSITFFAFMHLFNVAKYQIAPSKAVVGVD